MRKLIPLFLLAPALGGCAILGGGPAAPDEFAVARNAPLIIPPDYTLTPPVAGTATATPARRCRSWWETSATLTAYARFSSAISGRTTDRFCLSEKTSPSSRSNSSTPTHADMPATVGDEHRGRRHWAHWGLIDRGAE